MKGSERSTKPGHSVVKSKSSNTCTQKPKHEGRVKRSRKQGMGVRVPPGTGAHGNERRKDRYVTRPARAEERPRERHEGGSQRVQMRTQDHNTRARRSQHIRIEPSTHPCPRIEGTCLSMSAHASKSQTPVHAGVRGKHLHQYHESGGMGSR